MIRIQSKREGFRRCGVEHSKAPTDWPDDRFSFDELERLRHEPMLAVTYIEETPDPGAKAEAETGDMETGDGTNTVVEQAEPAHAEPDPEKKTGGGRKGKRK